jgi:hypothetical protein
VLVLIADYTSKPLRLLVTCLTLPAPLEILSVRPLPDMPRLAPQSDGSYPNAHPPHTISDSPHRSGHEIAPHFKGINLLPGCQVQRYGRVAMNALTCWRNWSQSTRKCALGVEIIRQSRK